MSSLSKREKVLIGVMLLCVVFYGYIKLLLNPIIDNLNEVNSTVNTYKSQLNLLNTASSDNKMLEKKLEDLQTRLADAVKALPLSERSPEAAFNIKQFADSSKVKLNSLTFGQAMDYSSKTQSNANNNSSSADQNNSASKLMYLPVTISVTGDYNSIINFISSIENGNRIAEISSADFTNSTGTLQATIIANFYFTTNGSSDNYDYDFNKGSYGKDDLFK